MTLPTGVPTDRVVCDGGRDEVAGLSTRAANAHLLSFIIKTRTAHGRFTTRKLDGS